MFLVPFPQKPHGQVLDENPTPVCRRPTVHSRLCHDPSPDPVPGMDWYCILYGFSPSLTVRTYFASTRRRSLLTRCKTTRRS